MKCKNSKIQNAFVRLVTQTNTDILKDNTAGRVHSKLVDPSLANGVRLEEGKRESGASPPMFS